MGDVSKRTVAALKRAVEQLESGEPIEVTVVSQEQTPDGPLTTRRPGVLKRKSK